MEELNLQQMLDSLPVASYATDPQGRLTYFNKAAVALSGRVPEIGTDKWCVAWKLYSPDGALLPHDQCPLAVLLAGKKPKPGQECIAERPDGSRISFTPFPTILRDATGRMIGGLNMLVAVNGRKMTREQCETEFARMFDAVPECVTIVAPDGNLLQMNASGMAMIGSGSVHAVIGEPICDLIVPEHRERFREFNQRVCAG